MGLKDTKVIVAIAVVAILVIAGVAVVVMNNNSSKSHDDLKDMTWSEIEDKARGTDVAIAFYFDAPCMTWFNNVMVKEAKEKYDINLTCVGYKTAAAAINEYKNSGSIPYEFVWGRASDLYTLINYDGNKNSLILQSDWESKMPNMKYSDGLADESWKATYEGVYGEGTYSRDVCSVTPFSGSTTSFVFNKAFNDDTIAWNEVKITSTAADKTVKVIKVAATGTDLGSGTAVADIDASKTYTIASVRAYRIANEGAGAHVLYGLPHSYTELNTWSVLYPQQFYLPSATGNASFHVQLILEAMVYELAAKGSSWIACTDKSADVWSGDLNGKFKDGDNAANKATYREYINGKILANAISADKYAEQIPYVKAYLQDTAPNWNATLTGTKEAVTDPNKTLVGNADPSAKDFSASTIMIALNSTETLANRTYMYNCEIGVYMPDTACSNRCGLFLMKGTPNPYGAIVIANLFNDPKMQASYYSIAGNAYNVDYETLSSEQQGYFDSYWAEWDAFDKPYISPEAVSSNRTMPAIGYLEAFLSQYANPYIKA